MTAHRYSVYPQLLKRYVRRTEFPGQDASQLQASPPVMWLSTFSGVI